MKFKSVATIKLFLTVSFAMFAFLILWSQPTIAQSNLVTDPESIGGSGTNGNDFFAEIATTTLNSQGFNNNLEAPRSFAKLSYDRPGGNFFRIGYCNATIHAGCYSSGPYNSRNNLDVIICALNAAEDAILSGGCREYVGPARDFNHTINPGVLSQRSTKNLRYNYLAIIQFPGNRPQDAAYPIHAFRLRAANNDGTAGFFAQQNLDRNNLVNQFVLGDSIDTPLAVQNRNRNQNIPNATHQDNVRLRFRVDCDIPASESSFRLGWADADAAPGSIPYNPDINWVLVQYRDGVAIDLRTVDSERGAQSRASYLGGQNATRGPVLTGFDLEPGDLFVWEWQNVVANNGIQFKIPYDDANIIDSCPPATQTTAGTCTINITSPANRIIAPGQAITGTITAENTGTTDWEVRYGVTGFPPGRSVRLGSSDNSNRWGANTARIAIPPSSGNELQAGATRTTNPIAFRAPSDIEPGDEPTMQYRIIDEGGSSANRLISTCSVEFRVRVNKPYLSVSGGDVISGANFSTLNGTCTATASATRANIKTTGSYSDNPADLDHWLGYSSGQYAVFASGRIGNVDSSTQNAFLGSNGYLRDPGTGGDPPVRDLLFGNNSAVAAVAPGETYGYFNHTSGNSQVPCYDISVLSNRLSNSAIQTSPAATLNVLTGNNPFDPDYMRHQGDLTIPSSTISGRKILYVEGRVTISGDVVYGSYSSVERIPYLMIIATDGIAIEVGSAPNYLRQIDGHLVSIPTFQADGTPSSTSTGKIDTCSNRFGGPFTWPARFSAEGLRANICNIQLEINGSMVAKQILWKRPVGSIGNAESVISPATCYPVSGYPGSGDVTSYVNSRLDDCAAEYINFSPEAYISNPNEHNVPFDIDSVPITTTELPPIY